MFRSGKTHIPMTPCTPRKFVLLMGKPGTGKTHCVHKAMDEALDDEHQIMVAMPTGFLATIGYGNVFGTHISTDTIQCLQVPGHIYVLMLDEISMIPKRTANHII